MKQRINLQLTKSRTNSREKSVSKQKLSLVKHSNKFSFASETSSIKTTNLILGGVSTGREKSYL